MVLLAEQSEPTVCSQTLCACGQATHVSSVAVLIPGALEDACLKAVTREGCLCICISLYDSGQLVPNANSAVATPFCVLDILSVQIGLMVLHQVCCSLSMRMQLLVACKTQSCMYVTQFFLTGILHCHNCGNFGGQKSKEQIWASPVRTHLYSRRHPVMSALQSIKQLYSAGCLFQPIIPIIKCHQIQASASNKACPRCS